MGEGQRQGGVCSRGLLLWALGPEVGLQPHCRVAPCGLTPSWPPTPSRDRPSSCKVPSQLPGLLGGCRASRLHSVLPPLEAGQGSQRPCCSGFGAPRHQARPGQAALWPPGLSRASQLGREGKGQGMGWASAEGGARAGQPLNLLDSLEEPRRPPAPPFRHVCSGRPPDAASPAGRHAQLLQPPGPALAYPCPSRTAAPSLGHTTPGELWLEQKAAVLDFCSRSPELHSPSLLPRHTTGSLSPARAPGLPIVQECLWFCLLRRLPSDVTSPATVSLPH